ncbi:MAG: hypothetical protein COB30_003730 [Ectothiorhodospiraceae bacterium]|nr:hypothetical protein [Ectothiorhodospiraceae bacterium]
MKKGLINNKNAQQGLEKKDAMLNIRATKSDKDRWSRCAADQNMKLATWVEQALHEYYSKTKG